MIQLICTGNFKEDYANMLMLTDTIHERSEAMYNASKAKQETKNMIAEEDKQMLDQINANGEKTEGYEQGKPPSREQIMAFLNQIRINYEEDRKNGMTHD